MTLIVIVVVRLKVTRVLHFIMGLSRLLVLVLILTRIVGALGVAASCHTPSGWDWNGRLVHLGHLGLMSVSHVRTRQSQRVLSANDRPSILELSGLRGTCMPVIQS